MKIRKFITKAWLRLVAGLLCASLIAVEAGAEGFAGSDSEEEVDASEVLLRGDNYFFGFYTTQITTDKNRLMNADDSASSGSGYSLYFGRDISSRVSAKGRLGFNEMNELSTYSQTVLGGDFILHFTDSREFFNPYVSGGLSIISNDYNLEDRFTGTALSGASVSGSSTNFGLSNGYGVLIDPNLPWLLDGRVRLRLEYSLEFDLNDAVPQGTSYFYDQHLNIGVEYVFRDFGEWTRITATTLADKLAEEEAARAEEEAARAEEEAAEQQEREEQEEQARIEAEALLRSQEEAAGLGIPGVLGQPPIGAFPGVLSPDISEFAILGDVRNKNVVYFGESSSYFNTIQRIKLLDISEVLKQNPFYRIEIIGHSEANLQISDPVERARFNREISARRALRIYNFFIRQGITENRMSPKWRADQDILNGSRTGAERAVNRRAVLNLVLEQPR